MSFFTVFTPTYNRAYILNQLYESLCNQTYKNFEWLIVDDGSTDETERLIHEWEQQEHKFHIIYKKKENGGKPRAINYGLQYANGEFFFMVDSDDWLYPEALEKLDKWCQEIKNDSKFVGVGAARGNLKGEYLKGVPPIVNEKKYVDATNLDRNKYNLDVDMCEAYKTEIFRQFPMAEWPKEKFAPEQIALNNIALAGYLLRWHSDIIYICDYLDDGLTKGSAKLEKNNPMGHAMMYNHKLLYPNMTRKQKFFVACQHVALSLYGKHPEYILKSNDWRYTILAMPFGVVLSVRRYLQFRKV